MRTEVILEQNRKCKGCGMFIYKGQKAIEREIIIHNKRHEDRGGETHISYYHPECLH